MHKYSRYLLACSLGLFATGCIIPVPVSDQPRQDEVAPEDEWHGHFSFPLGIHKASDDFDGASEQIGLGLVDFDIQPPDFPVSIVLQSLFGFADDVPDGRSFDRADYTTSSQLNLGVRKIWQQDAWQPFVGGGVSFVDVALYEDDNYYYGDDHIDSESDFGYWLGVGAYYAPRPGFMLGFTAQYVFDADVELLDRDFDAGGLDVLLMIGFGW